MTLILCLSGSSGASVLPSFISAPLPLAHQWLPLMPLPMNSTAKRCGKAAAGAATDDAAPSPAQAESDSSQGRATVTPAPRRTARREEDTGAADAWVIVVLGMRITSWPPPRGPAGSGTAGW